MILVIYIFVKGTLTVTGTNNRSKKNRLMQLYMQGTCTMIEYSNNYRMTTGSLWNNYRDELTDDTNNINFPRKINQPRVF